MAEESLQLVEYPINATTNFLLCRQCRTHIALLQKIDLFQFGTAWMVIKDLVNVSLDENDEISNGESTVRSVYCTTCMADLGFKFMYLENEDQHVKIGRYLICRRRLLAWYRNEMHDLVTLEQLQPV